MYTDFGTWLHQRFPYKVQKISVNAGLSCPNRDGRIGIGGCIYCDNRTFNPAYCATQPSITEQLGMGKHFFARKYPEMKYLAYFQAFTNTYAPVDKLKAMYEEALAVEDVVGVVIATRPDCVSGELLDYLESLSHQTFLLVEYGIESANDETLRRIHRGHDFACSRRAVEKTHERGILVGGHVILGLPGEGREECLRQAPIISSLPLDILKMHQLQVIRNTPLAKEFERSPFHVFSLDEYVQLVVDYIKLLRDDLVLERFVSQSPPDMVIAPKWGVKNHEFTALVRKKLENEVKGE